MFIYSLEPPKSQACHSEMLSKAAPDVDEGTAEIRTWPPHSLAQHPEDHRVSSQPRASLLSVPGSWNPEEGTLVSDPDSRAPDSPSGPSSAPTTSLPLEPLSNSSHYSSIPSSTLRHYSGSITEGGPSCFKGTPSSPPSGALRRKGRHSPSVLR